MTDIGDLPPAATATSVAELGPIQPFLHDAFELSCSPMTPTLALGPWDSPSIELMPSDIEPLVILMIETQAPLSKLLLDSIWSFITLDTLHLRPHSTAFFQALETVCQLVVAGRLTQFDATRIKGSEFDGYLHRHLGDGSITRGARVAAQRFLEFLAANPAHWPPGQPAS